MNKEAALNQINAIRTMCDVLEQEIRKEPDKSQCDHRDIRNLTTMGGPEEWICKNCNLHYKEEGIEA